MANPSNQSPQSLDQSPQPLPMAAPSGSTSRGPSPILRWAGGKRWLLPVVRRIIGETPYIDYHEPFCGGSAVFLGLSPHGNAWLSDLNQDLIETYRTVRDDPLAVASSLSKLKNDKDSYYAVRASDPNSSVDRAAKFIFLNHTSYNGLYRVNLQGRYNVPYGYRAKPNIPTTQHLQAFAELLRNATLESKDFAEVLDWVGPGDLVFLDPPYTTAHNTNGFVKYNQRLFSFDDQHRLSRVIDDIRRLGAHYILTNAAHSSISELFEKGDHRIELSRRNVIGGERARRGTTSEYLFTNLEVDPNA